MIVSKGRVAVLALVSWHLAVDVSAQVAPATATNEPDVIDELVVTGQAVQQLHLDGATTTGSRLNLSLFDMPASIDIIDSATMTARGFKSVTDAAESLPGVLAGEAPGEPSSFSMRGFQQNQITELRDGLRAGPHNMTMRPQNTFNLERVEILKGPGSVLYGEGAVAGTINMITKKPELGQEPRAEALFSYGRYDSWEFGFGAGASLTDRAAFRIDIDNSVSDGWIQRADSRSTNITAGILWAASARLEVMLTMDYLDDNLPSYWGTPLVDASFSTNYAMGDVISSTDGRTLDLRTRFLNYNVSDHVSESAHFWGRFLVEWRASENVTVRNLFYTFTADRRWINSEQYVFNPITQLVDRDRFFVLHDQDMRGNRIDVTVEHNLGALTNSVLMGVDYNALDFVRSRGFPDGDSVDVLNPLPGTFGPLEKRFSPTRMKNIAFFAEDRLAVTDKLSLVVGFRYDDIDLVRENFDPDGSLDSATSFMNSYEPFSWRLGTVFQMTPAIAIYAQHGVAQDPPSSSSLFLVNAARNFELSESRQWEIGLKAQTGGAGANMPTEITLSLFDIARDNILTQISQTEASNIGSQWSRGVELALATNITNRWRVGGNAAYIDAEYGLFVDPDFGIDATGNRPPNVPTWAVNLWTSFSEVGGLPLELGGGMRYISDRFANSGNTVKLLGYTLLDVFAALSIRNSRIMLRARNLTDVTYSPWADIYYPNQVVLGSPRTYEISLHTNF